MNLMRAPDDEEPDWFVQPLGPYLWLARFIVCAALLIGGLHILAVVGIVYFGVSP